jgi:hypothetical protein
MWLSNNFENLFIRNNALFVKLREKGNLRIGGLKMVEPVRFPNSASPAAVGVTSGYTAVTQSAMGGFTAADYTPAEYIIPVSVEEYDLDQQTTEETKIDWAQAIVEQGVDITLVKLESDLWADSNAAGSGGNTRNSLGSIKNYYNAGTAATVTAGAQPAELAAQLGNRGVCDAASETLLTVVGDLDRAVTGGGYWCCSLLNTSQVVGILSFSNLLSATASGGRRADLIFTHSDVFDKLMSLSTIAGSNGGQFLTNDRMGALGFDSLRFRGADIITDDRVPTISYLNGTTTSYGYNAFAINTDFIKLRARSMKPGLKPVSDARPLKVWTGRFLGQLTAKNLGRTGARHVFLTLT